MITRVTGRVVHAEGNAVHLAPDLPGADPARPPLVLELLCPAYFAAAAGERGGLVTLHTLHHLESHNQGATLVPRLLGFPSPVDRAFFELFTSVKGVGPRKALRALAEPPAIIASAIARRDTAALQKLPEIGKRLAETVVAELVGKVDRFVLGDVSEHAPPPARARPAAAEEAVRALVALGQTPSEAERAVDRAVAAAEDGDLSAGDLVAKVFASA